MKRAVPASLVFASISKFSFLVFSKFTICKLTIAVTTFLLAFLIKSNNKKLDQKIFHVSGNLIIFHVQCYFALHIPDNINKSLIMFQQADVYLNEPIKIDEKDKLSNQQI